MWLNFQDWKIYGVTYAHNVPTEHMQPIGINPLWESTIIDLELLYINNDKKIAVKDDALDSLGGTGFRPTGPRDHGDVLIGKGKGRSFWDWLGQGFKDVVEGVGGWFRGMGNGSGGSGGGPSGGGGADGGDFEPGPTPGGYGGGGTPPSPPPGGGWGWGPGAGGGGGTPTTPPEEEDPVISIWEVDLQSNVWGSLEQPNNDPIPIWVNGAVIDGNSNAIAIENPTVTFLTNVLGLTATQTNWLRNNSTQADRMMAYILAPVPGVSQQEKHDAVREHLIKMMDDAGYNTFVNNYNQNNAGMWWINENWLDNPANDFVLTPNQGYNASELKAAEKALIAIYPVQAYIIKGNRGVAEVVSAATGLPQPLNGKQDAFRHAFFQAINVRDVPGRLGMMVTGSQIVSLFAYAHETQTPAGEELPRDIDVHNNNVGIALCVLCASNGNSNDQIRDLILVAVSSGSLRYLNPLTIDGFIIQGTTQMIPTNQ